MQASSIGWGLGFPVLGLTCECKVALSAFDSPHSVFDIHTVRYGCSADDHRPKSNYSFSSATGIVFGNR